MWTWGIGLLLLGHAFVHAVWRTYGPKTSWLLANVKGSTLASVSTALFIAGAIGFGLAGLGLLIHRGWWQPVAVVSSIISLLLLAIFWNKGLFVGAAIDVAVLVAILWLKWPSQVFAAR
jgi:hypothetical protein